MRRIPLGTTHPRASPSPQHPLLVSSPDDWESTNWSEKVGAMGNSHLRGEKGGGGRNSGRALPEGAGAGRARSYTGPRTAGAARGPPSTPAPTAGEGAGAQERRGLSWEEAEEEREAGRAGPTQELGGATHLCSRPAEPERPGSLAAPTRRSGHAPTLPPSSQLLLQLQPLHHRRAQPGNHDGRAARALTHLPPVSPPPPAFLP